MIDMSVTVVGSSDHQEWSEKTGLHIAPFPWRLIRVGYLTLNMALYTIEISSSPSVSECLLEACSLHSVKHFLQVYESCDSTPKNTPPTRPSVFSPNSQTYL